MVSLFYSPEFYLCDMRAKGLMILEMLASDVEFRVLGETRLSVFFVKSLVKKGDLEGGPLRWQCDDHGFDLAL